MKRYLSLFVVVTLLCAQGAFPQQKSDTTPPAPGNVTLSLDEYNRLLALADRPGKHAEVPPVPYILKSADPKNSAYTMTTSWALWNLKAKRSVRMRLKSRWFPG